MAAIEQARRLGRRFLMVDNGLVVAGFYLVFPLIGLHFIEQLGWAAAAVGLALGLRQLSQQGLGLISGSLSDRFGAKPMIVAGMLLRAAGFAVMAYAHQPALLLLSCILSGLGGSLFEPARGALVVKLTRPSERNRFYALMMTQESAAGVLGALVGTALLACDFYWVAMGGCAVFVLAAALNALLLPPYRVAVRRTSAFRAMRTVLHDRPFLLLVLTLSGYYVMQVQLMLLLPVLVTQVAGSARAVGWLYGMDAVLALLLLYPLARLGERHASEEARIVFGVGVMASSLAALALTRGTVAVFALLGSFFIGSMVVEPAREALLARRVHPSARASYFGMSRIGLALGGLFGYTSGGALLDHARAADHAGLPWLVLGAIGASTAAALAWQFVGHARPASAVRA